jgi:glycerol-3-phosphate dehydrogenase
VFGGKLTTSRRLSEDVVDRIGALIGPMGPRWTRGAKLPGGDFAPSGFEAEVAKLQQAYPALDPKLTRRLVRLYGTRAAQLLGPAEETDDLGPHFGADLYAREVDYLMAKEWARAADDVLWRRTKLGLRVSVADKDRLAAYMAERV